MAGQMLVRRSSRQAGASVTGPGTPGAVLPDGTVCPSRFMSSTGTTTCRSRTLRDPTSTTATSRPGPTPPKETGNRFERSLGRRQTDPLDWWRVRTSKVLESLKGYRQVRSTLAARDRMDRTRTLPGIERVRGGVGSRASRSRHHRNAARVLPLPVGAWMSVCRPAAIAAQPPTWAGVGRSNADPNHERTAGAKGASGSEWSVIWADADFDRTATECIVRHRDRPDVRIQSWVDLTRSLRTRGHGFRSRRHVPGGHRTIGGHGTRSHDGAIKRTRIARCPEYHEPPLLVTAKGERKHREAEGIER